MDEAGGPEEDCWVVPTVPEDAGQRDHPHGFLWGCDIRPAITFVLICIFIWRIFQFIASRLYVVKKKKLAVEHSGLIKENCDLLDKPNFLEKEATNEQLKICKSKLDDKVLSVEKQFEQELEKCDRPELVAKILPALQALKDGRKSLNSQIADATTTTRPFQIIHEAIKAELEKVFNENVQLHQELLQLSEEPGPWKEKLRKAADEAQIGLENTKIRRKQLLRDARGLFEVKDPSSSLVVVEDTTKNNDKTNLNVKNDENNCGPLGYQQGKRWPTSRSCYKVENKERRTDPAEKQTRRHRIAGRGVGKTLDCTEVRSTQPAGTVRKKKKRKRGRRTGL
ncbi:cTAGE family member 2-like, partial [Ochotona curzoniae]|uniref:cTAGE family member 2-like n=1 Tax=Ochotona curzoniae TaxID=130825 RepID=UPI001B347F95